MINFAFAPVLARIWVTFVPLPVAPFAGVMRVARTFEAVFNVTNAVSTARQSHARIILAFHDVLPLHNKRVLLGLDVDRLATELKAADATHEAFVRPGSAFGLFQEVSVDAADPGEFARVQRLQGALSRSPDSVFAAVDLQ